MVQPVGETQQATETAKTPLAYGYDEILYAKNTPVFH